MLSPALATASSHIWCTCSACHGSSLERACRHLPGEAATHATFLIALIYIGCLTALIGDLASHMGCCMNLKASPPPSLPLLPPRLGKKFTAL